MIVKKIEEESCESSWPVILDSASAGYVNLRHTME